MDYIVEFNDVETIVNKFYNLIQERLNDEVVKKIYGDHILSRWKSYEIKYSDTETRHNICWFFDYLDKGNRRRLYDYIGTDIELEKIIRVNDYFFRGIYTWFSGYELIKLYGDLEDVKENWEKYNKNRDYLSFYKTLDEEKRKKLVHWYNYRF